jgi:hypothetical protein
MSVITVRATLIAILAAMSAISLALTVAQISLGADTSGRCKRLHGLCRP